MISVGGKMSLELGISAWASDEIGRTCSFDRKRIDREVPFPQVDVEESCGEWIVYELDHPLVPI